MNYRKSFPALYGLKGLSIFLIVIYHTLALTPFFQKIPLATFFKTYGGSLGNCLFFLMSGFLIADNYLDRIKTREICFKSFAYRRLSKIYPLYLLSNLVALTIQVLRHGWSVINLNDLLMMVFLQIGGGLSSGMPYNYPTWFISTLLLCYFIFFFIAYHAKSNTHYFCYLVSLIFLGHFLMTEKLAYPFLQGENGIGLFTFFLGSLLAGVYPALEKRSVILSSGSILTIGFTGFLLLSIGVNTVISHIIPVFTLLLALPTLLITLNFWPCTLLLKSKPMVYLGKISMHVFFWHTILFDIIETELYTLGILQDLFEIRYLIYCIVLVSFSALSNFVVSNYSEKRST